MDRDLKDIVGIAADPSKAKKEKKKPATAKKPDGLSRELYGLVGSATVEVPLYPADPLRGLKQKRKVKPTAAAHWELCEVPCSSRPPGDSFQVLRWLSKEQHEKLQKGTYQDHLQALNRPIRVFKYTDAEFETHLKDESGRWTKELTDELFGLCERFDLRWVVVHDRFSADGWSIEDLKDRYYGACAALLRARCDSEADRQRVKQHPILAAPYNKEQEEARKRHLAVLWARTREEEQEEARLRQQMRAIEQVRRRKQEREQRERYTMDRKDRQLWDFVSQQAQQRGLKRRLGADEGSESPSESTLAARLTKRLKPGVVLRSQLISNPGPGPASPSQKEIDTYVERLGLTMPTQRTFELVCEVREMVERYYDLKQRVQQSELRVRDIMAKRDELGRRLLCLRQTTAEGLSPALSGLSE
eukprot:EG_transcript_13796